ncbi:50S ribosomal protein L29 [Saccharicrinis sp. FJH2]|uniref:50S ribosomal protein L29 n=1 Tax=unclassified Saccharicrinis TaxID=2646859 RepID=UPI0035D4597E
MKARELKDLESKELQERLETEVDNLAKMKINHSISPLDNPSKIKESRKTIARIKTELRLREINEVK